MNWYLYIIIWYKYANTIYTINIYHNYHKIEWTNRKINLECIAHLWITSIITVSLPMNVSLSRSSDIRHSDLNCHTHTNWVNIKDFSDHLVSRFQIFSTEILSLLYIKSIIEVCVCCLLYTSVCVCVLYACTCVHNRDM